jgi:thymidylate kinase
MSYNTQYTRIVFEGVPSSGKSVLSVAFAKRLQAHFATDDGCLVLLNHCPVHENAGEVILDKDSNIIEHIYTAGKEQYIAEAATISARLMTRELETLKKYVLTGQRRLVINVMEHCCLYSISVFIPAAFKNMRKSSDVPRNHSDTWCNVKPAQDNMLVLAKMLDQFHEPSSTLVVYIRCSAALAYKRVLERGRKFEATGLTYEYMRVLEDYHEKCISCVDDDRVVGVDRLGLTVIKIVSADECAADSLDTIETTIAPMVDSIWKAYMVAEEKQV